MSLGTGEEPVLPRALLWPFSDQAQARGPGQQRHCPLQLLLSNSDHAQGPWSSRTSGPNGHSHSQGQYGSLLPCKGKPCHSGFSPVRGWLAAWGLSPGLQWGCLRPCTDLAEDGVLGQGSGESSKESQFDPSLPNCYEDMFVMVGGDTYFI